MAKLAIIDDNPIIRDGMSLLLSEQPSPLKCVGAFLFGSDVFEKIEEVSPDIVLIDIEAKYKRGIKYIRKVKQKYPEIKVIALTVYAENELIAEALKLGADGYIIKSMTPAKIIDNLKSMIKGKFAVSPYIAKSIASPVKKKKIIKN